MEGITQEDRSVCLCTKASPCSPIPNFQFDARCPSGYCLTSLSLTYPTFPPNAAFIPVNLTFLTLYAPFSCMPSYPLLPSPWTLSTKLDGSNFRAQGMQLLPPLLLISLLFCSTVHTLLTAGTLSTGYLPWEMLWQGALSKDDTTNTHSIPHVLFPMCPCQSSKDRWGLGGHLYLHSQWNAVEMTPFIKGSVVSLEIHASEALSCHVRSWVILTSPCWRDYMQWVGDAWRVPGVPEQLFKYSQTRHQTCRWWSLWETSDPEISWEIPSQNCSVEMLSNSWPTKLSDDYSFQSLSCGVVRNTAIITEM